MNHEIDRRICIAPMLGWTDRHARYFLRQISRHAWLCSEMLSPEPIVRGRGETFMRYDPEEHPVAYQLGGSDPKSLAEAARQLERLGYDEINFNVGCPSERGQTCLYGAHLIPRPELVRTCVTAMRDAVSIPVTVKTRIGIDRDDAYEPLANFVDLVRSSCQIFYIHARKAWLDGLDPHQNRTVPPLRYDFVYRLKRDFPDLTIIINGGITEWERVREHLEQVDGVMIGRRAYKDPYWLSTADRQFYGSKSPPPSRVEVLQRCIPYVERELARGTRLRSILRHMIGLYHGATAARVFRQLVTAECNRPDGRLDHYLKLIEVCQHEPGRTAK